MTDLWYAVRTMSRHELRVEQRLQGKEFHVYLPQIEVWSRRVDRRLKILRPLFPGYLFVQFALTHERWVEILKTPGVAAVLGYDHRPFPIPEEQIFSIQTVLQSGLPVRYHPYLNVGDQVRIVSGPLTGAVGILVGVNEKRERLVISVDLLNRAIEVEIESYAVEAC